MRIPGLGPFAAPVGALAAGAAVAAVMALAPAAMLEDWVWRSGIPALVPAAAPPLGTTARAVLALAGFALSASVTWSLLYLLVGPGGLLAPEARVGAVPMVRRADAHPDAPPRRPMTAADLGLPLMDVPVPAVPAPPPVERSVPADLDQPLSAYDPAAIPAVPLTSTMALPPLPRRMLAPGERIDTYVLPTPPPPPTRPAAARRQTVASGSAPSIDALLRRLEARLGSVPAR